MNFQSVPIGDLLFSIHKELKRTLERNLKPFEIGIGQLQILLLFYSDMEESYTQREITLALGVDKGNISRSIQKLMEKNFINFCEKDHRAYRLTEAGKDLKSAISNEFFNIHEKMCDGLDVQALRITSQTLSSIQERLEKL